jgi:hypothetical protein
VHLELTYGIDETGDSGGGHSQLRGRTTLK